MRLFITLPVLVVVLAMALEGPAPAQAAPDLSRTLENIPVKLKELRNNLEDKARAVIENIKEKDILNKTRTWFSDTFSKMKEKLRNTFA